jgi:4-amino-4-deoxy-L-arabinose transferase-like glycosyltransferase
MLKILKNPFFLAVALWLAYGITMAFILPAFPVDETRYLTVAWEMRHSGDWLLPTLNYAPYSHKPPLLIWLINALWSVGGLSTTTARFVPVLNVLACLFLTRKLAQSIYPDRPTVAMLAPLFLITSPAALIYGSMIMFDWLMTIWVLSAFIVLWRIVQGGSWCLWFLVGLFMGIGVLTKGPVAALYIGAPALFMPFALGLDKKKSWYGGLVAALGVATVVGLAWALPAAMIGGEDYANMIFKEQTAGRVVNAFDHKRPLWFYLPFVPVMILPLLFFKSFWRKSLVILSAAKNLLQSKKSDPSPLAQDDKVGQFLGLAVIVPFIAFSIISSKQIHYLVPLAPFVMILLAARLENVPDFTRSFSRVAMGMVGVFAAAIIIAAITYFPRYDLRSVAAATQPYHDRPMAYVRKYAGEIGFLARLDKPMEVMERSALQDWFAAHPDGIAIVRHEADDPVQGFAEISSFPYKADQEFTILRVGE